MAARVITHDSCYRRPEHILRASAPVLFVLSPNEPHHPHLYSLAKKETNLNDEKEQAAQTAAWPQGISAITLFVEDMEAAREFYQRVFELPVMFEDDASTVFEFGNTLINLLKTSAAPELIRPAAVASQEAGHRMVFTITVDDVDALCARLVERGVELLNGPMERPWGIRTASFIDPGGHIWEIAR